MSRIHFLLGWALVVCWVPQSARAAEILLNFTSDDDSTYYEYSSGAFARMDLYSDTVPTAQSFRDINAPANYLGNKAFDAFPKERDFRFGSIGYIDTVGGNGVVDIAELVLGIERNPLDSTHVNHSRFTPMLTKVVSYSGTVTLVGGAPTAVNLTSGILLNFGVGDSAKHDFEAEFNIAGTSFELTGAGNHTFFVPLYSTNFAVDAEWDFSGSFTDLQAVPEPATWAMMGLGLCVLGLTVRRGAAPSRLLSLAD